MQTIKNELIVFSDCDDTLVIWRDDSMSPGDGKVEIVDPYDGSRVFLYPHIKHIKLLADYKARGYTIFVWSAAGQPWSEAVVKALEIENIVDFVMSKPVKYMDDLHAKDILGQRVYIPFMGVE